jgi:hypothetical protein
MSLLCMVASVVNSDIRLWESTMKPIGESVVISNKCHLEAPFFLIEFGPIKAYYRFEGQADSDMNCIVENGSLGLEEAMVGS